MYKFQYAVRASTFWMEKQTNINYNVSFLVSIFGTAEAWFKWIVSRDATDLYLYCSQHFNWETL